MPAPLLCATARTHQIQTFVCWALSRPQEWMHASARFGLVDLSPRLRREAQGCPAARAVQQGIRRNDRGLSGAVSPARWESRLPAQK
eukprot:gene14084-biopygen5082